MSALRIGVVENMKRFRSGQPYEVLRVRGLILDLVMRGNYPIGYRGVVASECDVDADLQLPLVAKSLSQILSKRVGERSEIKSAHEPNIDQTRRMGKGS